VAGVDYRLNSPEYCGRLVVIMPPSFGDNRKRIRDRGRKVGEPP
jgi:hypothetical protein